MRVILGAAGALTMMLVETAAAQLCTGNCNGNGNVAINELITIININVGAQPASGVCRHHNYVVR